MIFFRIVIAIYFIFNFACTSSEKSLKSQLVGKVYSEYAKLPKLSNYKQILSGSLSYPNKKESKYGITGLIYNNDKLLILEKLVYNNEKGEPFFKILDIFQTSADPLAYWMCTTPIDTSLQTDYNLVALIMHDENKTSYVLDAWKIVIDENMTDNIKMIPIDKTKVEYVQQYEFSALFYKE